MSMPAISVVIPTYNAARFLGEALDSVFAQSYTDYEVIVVDDGSQDNTPEVVAGYPGVTYVQCPHRGISATRNHALSLARGEWIAFLDADDYWHPEKLEKQMRYVKRHPDCEILYAQMKNFYDGDVAAMTPAEKRLMQLEASEHLPTALIHRTLFERIGMFREDFVVGEDTDWQIRLRAAAVDNHHFLPEVLYHRRIHGKNITLQVTTAKTSLTMLARSLRSARKASKAEENSKTEAE